MKPRKRNTRKKNNKKKDSNKKSSFDKAKFLEKYTQEQVSTTEYRSGMINCNQKYMNCGKYKGKDISRVPLSYLEWLATCDLNPSERKLINRTIKIKREKIKARESDNNNL